MKNIWCFALLALVFSASICAAKVPDLMGNWSGSGIGYYEGSIENEENGSVILTVTEQKDRIFSGNLTFKQMNGTDEVEGFAGAIGMDNKTLYMAEFDEGYDFGTIISDDEIELVYLLGGNSTQVFIERYHRM